MASILRCILIHTHKDRISEPTWTLKEQLRYCLSLLRLRVVHSFGSFFLSLLLGSRNARIPVVSCTSSSLILFVQGHCLNVLFLIKRFNYKMADLGQVSSLYSFLPSLGPGTVMGENGKKSRCKSKTKGEWTDPRGVMSPFLSQTPSCLFSRHCQAWSLATSCPARKLISPERSRLDSSPVRVFFGTRECLKLIPRQIKSIRVLWNFS